LNLFTLLYTIVALVTYLVAIPLLILFSFKKKYRDSIPARFFLWKNPPMSANGVWIHSCSFGEAKAIKPLIDLIPQSLLRLTTTTYTGFSEIKKHTSQSRYLPYELLLFGWMRPQKALIVMEAELWYLLFFLAKNKKAKTLLINARMSDRSYPKYLKLKWLYRKIFAQIDRVYAQSIEDKIRLESLGAKDVEVTGNIKFIDIAKPTKEIVKPDGLMISAGSTHDGEETLIVDAFRELKHIQADAKLIIAPRHPERFDKVDRLVAIYAKESGWSYSRYSDNKTLMSDITLIDSLGELINIYAISDIVILGGAFEPIGGHNAAEAAQFGCKIISGEHYFNQRDIFAGIDGITIVANDKLAATLKRYDRLSTTKISTKADLSSVVGYLEERGVLST